MPKRTAISKKARFEIFKRDGFSCQYCGASPPQVILQIDHIIPVVEGGNNDPDNLATSCGSCNSGKGRVSLEKVPKSLEDKAAEIREREEQLAGYTAVMMARADRIEAEAWLVAESLQDEGTLKSYWKSNLLSIKRFLRDLPLHEVLEAADIAKSKFPWQASTKRFRYFCGVCWRKIRRANE